ncbi:hypothetical protein T484DRAFT_1811842, partial [Baffinella frigidus]
MAPQEAPGAGFSLSSFFQKLNHGDDSFQKSDKLEESYKTGISPQRETASKYAPTRHLSGRIHLPGDNLEESYGEGISPQRETASNTIGGDWLGHVSGAPITKKEIQEAARSAPAPGMRKQAYSLLERTSAASSRAPITNKEIQEEARAAPAGMRKQALAMAPSSMKAVGTRAGGAVAGGVSQKSKDSKKSREAREAKGGRQARESRDVEEGGVDTDFSSKESLKEFHGSRVGKAGEPFFKIAENPGESTDAMKEAMK